jgi:hypothetical protein
MPFAEDQHQVGDLGPGRKHEPLRIGVRARAEGRDLHGLDAGVGQDCVERLGELPGPSRTRYRKSAARSPRSIKRLRTDLDHEEAVQALQGHRAVHVEEVDREHHGCLCLQELPPGRVGIPSGCSSVDAALRPWPSVETDGYPAKVAPGGHQVDGLSDLSEWEVDVPQRAIRAKRQAPSTRDPSTSSRSHCSHRILGGVR